jgi:RNA polymerase sigma-70 factor (ECF subfamily)
MNRTGQDGVRGDVGEDDATAIERSLRDPERFAVIFDRHAPYIHRYLARRLGQQLADDAVAETFLVAFRRRQRYDLGRRDARPWLYGIATNLVGQYRRDEVCHADRVAADVTAQAARQMLAEALAELSPQDRDVLLLIAWEELSYGEVAAALAIPVGTVRSRLNRARRKVRAALRAADPTMTFEEALPHG